MRSRLPSPLAGSFCHAAAILLVILAGSVAAAPTADAGAKPLGPPAALFPRDGTYLGARVEPAPGRSAADAVADLERGIGRPLAVERVYHRWWDAFPTPADVQNADAGHLLFVSWSAVTSRGTVTPWARIASGAYDRWIRARADAVRAFGRPMYLCFHHEPEDDTAFGSPTDFVAAYRHVVEVFRERGVANVAFVWTLMSASFADPGSTAAAFYPGNAYVDAVGVDAFNWYPGRAGARWRSFAEVVGPARGFARARDRPLVVAEFGVQEDPASPGRKAAWLLDAAATIRRWTDLGAVLYFDSSRGYPWRIASSPSSQAAFRTIADEPWLGVLPPLDRVGASLGLASAHRVSGAGAAGTDPH